MSHRLFKLGLVVCLAGAGLAAVQSRVRPPHDLDDYSDAQLLRDLEDELNDIYAALNPDEEFDLDLLKAHILDALGDDGDTGFETEITLADLEAEMAEAETSLEEVVDEALARADELAIRRRAPSWSLVQASFSVSAQKRDKATKPKVAVPETGRGFLAGIRRATGE